MRLNWKKNISLGKCLRFSKYFNINGTVFIIFRIIATNQILPYLKKNLQKHMSSRGENYGFYLLLFAFPILLPALPKRLQGTKIPLSPGNPIPQEYQIP